MTMPTVTAIQPNGQAATVVTNPAAAAAAIAAAGMAANSNVAAAIQQSVAAAQTAAAAATLSPAAMTQSATPVITAPTIQQTSQKDTTFTKLFVGGLPYHTTDKSLREHFEVYGDIDEAVVITDRQTGKSRGYGFVSHSPFLYSSYSKYKEHFISLSFKAFKSFHIFDKIAGWKVSPVSLPCILLDPASLLNEKHSNIMSSRILINILNPDSYIV